MKQIANRITLALVCLFILCQSVCAAEFLIPGGQLIGLQLSDHSVTVAAFDEAFGAQAQASGLQIGDRIVGGLGISGGTGEEDHALCEYGLRVFETL